MIIEWHERSGEEDTYLAMAEGVARDSGRSLQHTN